MNMDHTRDGKTTGSLSVDVIERKPVAVFRFGRGRTGGSTILDLVIRRARAEGRVVLIGDGDRRNPTLATLYPTAEKGGARQPITDELPDLKDFLMELLTEAVSTRTALVVDLGGGDRLMQEMGKDLALVDFCEENGIEPVAFYFCGPEMDDFEHVLSIWRAGYFRSRRGVLFLSEFLVPQGRRPAGAFEDIMAREEMLELIDGGIELVFVPRLACFKEMREAGLNFSDAAAGKRGASGKPFDLLRAFIVKSWVKKMEESFTKNGLEELLP
jgi:hypothetical protein